MSDPPEKRRSSSGASTDWRTSFRQASPYLSLGLQIALSMVFFVLGGYFLDRWLGSLPWLTIGGGVVGLASIIVHVFRISAQMGNNARRKGDPEDLSGT